MYTYHMEKYCGLACDSCCKTTGEGEREATVYDIYGVYMYHHCLLSADTHSDPYEEISMDGPPTVSTFHPNGLPPEYGPHVRVNPFYMPDSQEDMTASEQGNPSYDRLTHSDEQVAPSGHRVGPNVHRKQPNISIMLQGGSLPHVAHTQPYMESAGLRVQTLESVSVSSFLV